MKGLGGALSNNLSTSWRSTSLIATELIFPKADIIAEKKSILLMKKKILAYWNSEGK